MTDKTDDLRPFKFLGLSLLQWMVVIFVAGLVATLLAENLF